MTSRLVAQAVRGAGLVGAGLVAWRRVRRERHRGAGGSPASSTPSWCEGGVSPAAAPPQRTRTWTQLHHQHGPLSGPPRVHRIVITGGPCAGKTTAMAKLQVRLTDMGFAVYVVPELATLTITGGSAPGTMDHSEFLAWETAILRAQMHLEDTFAEIAQHCSPEQHSVLLCDRGTMDVLAYVGRDAFSEILEDNSWTIAQLRDKRYDAVIHLVTAAIGAEDFYTLENNIARMESRQEAIALDGKLSRAWVGHNSLHIIENNSGSFEEKMVRVTQAVCESLGVPGPRAKPRWWIVSASQEADWPADLEYAEWRLEHVFLKSTERGVESRVTKKSQSHTTYHLRVAGEMVNGEQSISERTLSFREYKALLVNADPDRTPIRKTRRAFIYNNDYYLLDTFHWPPATAGVTTLFVEKPTGCGDPGSLPPFVKLIEDVTTKKWFSSYAHDSWKRTMAMADELSQAHQATNQNSNTLELGGDASPPLTPPSSSCPAEDAHIRTPAPGPDHSSSSSSCEGGS